MPPGVIAPVTVTPPAGTFVPTGATPIVTPTGTVGAMPRTATAAAAAPGWGTVATQEDEGAAPAWDRLGVVAEEPEEDEEVEGHGYTWVHMIVLSLGAFVAGFLVWLLLLQGRVEPGGPDALAEELPDGAQAAVVVVENSGEK